MVQLDGRQRPPIRVILAEPHTQLRELTRSILVGFPDITVVGEAGDGREAVELVARLRPDVLVAAVRMPALGGFEVVRRVKSLAPDTQALLLALSSSEEYVKAAREAGAVDCLSQTCTITELVDAVRRAHLGEALSAQCPG